MIELELSSTLFWLENGQTTLKKCKKPNKTHFGAEHLPLKPVFRGQEFSKVSF